MCSLSESEAAVNPYFAVRSFVVGFTLSRPWTLAASELYSLVSLCFVTLKGYE